MRAPVAVIALLSVLALAGCVNGQAFPLTTKTETVADALRPLPGVTDVTTAAVEGSRYTPATSDVAVSVDPSATAAQLGTIVTTFVQANNDTGLDLISSTLDLLAGAENRLELAYGPATAAQGKGLVDAWLELRGKYDSATLSLTIGDDNPFEISATVDLPGDSTFDRDLAALSADRDLITELGPVSEYEQLDGRFGASDGFPDDTGLALLSTINAVAPITGMQYYGDEDTLGILSETASPETVVDLIPAAGSAVSITFALPDGTTVDFDNSSCNSYAGVAASDPAGALLLYWSRTGNGLRDGSAAASCFA